MSSLLYKAVFTNINLSDETIEDANQVTISRGSEIKNDNMRIKLKNDQLNVNSDGSIRHRWTDVSGKSKFEAVKTTRGEIINEEIIKVYAHYTDTDPTIDIESTGIDPMQAHIVGIAISPEAKKSFYIPLTHEYPGVPDELPLRDVLGSLKDILENRKVRKYGHNLKYEIILLKRHDIRMQGIYFDTMVGSYVLNPGLESHGLKNIAFE